MYGTQAERLACVTKQPVSSGIVKHVLLYDGVCGFCQKSIQFVLPRDPDDRFRFAALQSGVGKQLLLRHGITLTTLDTVYVLADADTARERVLSRSDAGLFVLGNLRGLWRLAGLLRVVPRFIRDRVYDAFAKRRYRWFGKTDTCLVPAPNERAKFLDANFG